jgi:hypothetical protein
VNQDSVAISPIVSPFFLPGRKLPHWRSRGGAAVMRHLPQRITRYGGNAFSVFESCRNAAGGGFPCLARADLHILLPWPGAICITMEGEAAAGLAVRLSEPAPCSGWSAKGRINSLRTCEPIECRVFLSGQPSEVLQNDTLFTIHHSPTQSAVTVRCNGRKELEVRANVERGII